MSYEYDKYLADHNANVKKAYDWLRENLPDLISDIDDIDYDWQICYKHDSSKTDSEEYDAYDGYFYSGNRSYQVVLNFKKAWLRHIHRNPHHWQYWILFNDDPHERETILEMPFNYVLEMICDWWSFSWAKGNPSEIFSWYEERKGYIKLHPDSRKTLEVILGQIENKLDEGQGGNTTNED
ncbi:MAG: DUF5662 family protein [Clostridia bacterium]